MAAAGPVPPGAPAPWDLLAGGTPEWSALIADPDRTVSGAVVHARVCLARPRAAREAAARDVLTTPDFV